MKYGQHLQKAFAQFSSALKTKNAPDGQQQADGYVESGQAAINQALLMNFALVCTDLDKKLKQRIQVQQKTKLSETKLRIA